MLGHDHLCALARSTSLASAWFTRAACPGQSLCMTVQTVNFHLRHGIVNHFMIHDYELMSPAPSHDDQYSA